MRIFDTNVQELKYKVLKEVAKLANKEELGNNKLLDIPNKIVVGSSPTMRCCIYKERAIVNERVKLAMGGDINNPNIIEVIDIACDECPVSGVLVGEACRGCIAHHCSNVCPKDAINFVNHKAIIDQQKCIECGKCVTVCPYNAISKNVRPCEKACKINAISMDSNKKANIDNNKCIECGACVYQCPFGAIMDKSFIKDAIEIINKSENNSKYHVYAVVAPSIGSQFKYVKCGQITTALKEFGFYSVVEAALGADMIAYLEAKELVEKGFLTSSCCPSFVKYVENFFPELKQFVSHNLSPMAQIAKYIKRTDPKAKIIFIGPCTAKKSEAKKEIVKEHVDCVITFEELQALIDSKEINVENLPETELDNATIYGRLFARSGGVRDAVARAIKELEIQDFDYNPIACNGLLECKVALLKKSKGILKENFIEGMACIDGCIGGAGCLTHGPKNKDEVDKYANFAKEKNIKETINILNFVKSHIK